MHKRAYFFTGEYYSSNMEDHDVFLIGGSIFEAHAKIQAYMANKLEEPDYSMAETREWKVFAEGEDLKINPDFFREVIAL